MKRTKQVYHREGDEVPKFVSGCRQFEGEDPRMYPSSFYLPFSSVLLINNIDYAERMKENADR